MSPLIGSVEVRSKHAQPAAGDPPGNVRSLTRQPILDQQGRVHGYELLFGTGNNVGPEASRNVLDDLVLFGFERLARGLPTFIRCSAEALTDRLVAVLPPPLTVLEIPQSLQVVPKLIDACCELRQAGFRLALVDCTHTALDNPLLGLVDYIKADFTRTDANALQTMHHRLTGNRAALIAENVQSQQDFRRAAVAGFTYFQGYYFCRPESLRNAKVPANKLVHIDILRQLFRDPLDLKELCPLVMRDAALVYRLLRLVNSPICAIRREVDSVQAAIIILGENTFRRITTLAIQCEMNAGQPSEIVRMALIRARFCERAAPLAELDANEQYLAGMMSMLPAMVQMPMTALASDLPLRQAVVEALLGAAVPERRLLDWLEALEHNNFAECYRISDIFSLDRDKLNQCYWEAIAWETQQPGVLE